MSSNNSYTTPRPNGQDSEFSEKYRSWRDDLLSRPWARIGDPYRVELRRAVRDAVLASRRGKYVWSGRRAR